MQPRDYGPFPYVPIKDRPKLEWPGGARVAVWIIPNIEFFPLNRGIVRREGRDVTLVTFSRMVHITMQAAEDLAKEGVEAEVIDLRSIRPLDLDLVLDSVRKTNRVVVAEEGWKYYGTGQGITSLIYEYAFDYLDAPVGLVTGKDVPMPYSKVLERAALPTKGDVVAAVRAIVPARAGAR